VKLGLGNVKIGKEIFPREMVVSAQLRNVTIATFPQLQSSSSGFPKAVHPEDR
jgi:hypothetical protein